MSNKNRFTLLGLLIIGLLFLAYTQVGLAQSRQNSEKQSELLVGQAGVDFDEDEDEQGSVKSPSKKKSDIKKPGTYSIGGVCTLKITSLAKNVSVSTALLGLESVGSLPTNWKYLAGVCSVEFFVGKTLVPEITAAQGRVEICFSKIPKTQPYNRIYLEGNNWSTLGTQVVKGLSCSPITRTGKYLMTGN